MAKRVFGAKEKIASDPPLLEERAVEIPANSYYARKKKLVRK